MAKWRPLSGAVVGFYSLPIIVLFRESFYSDLSIADFKRCVVVVLLSGLMGGGMGWMVCVLKNGWMPGR